MTHDLFTDVISELQGEIVRVTVTELKENTFYAQITIVQDGRELEEVTVVGCLCTPLDLLGDRVLLPRVDVGDLVVILQAGAYGLTASPTAFLGHPGPAEVLV